MALFYLFSVFILILSDRVNLFVHICIIVIQLMYIFVSKK